METSRTRRSLGICLGASSVQAVQLALDGAGLRVERTLTRNHESDPRRVFLEVLEELDGGASHFGLLTGRKFKSVVNARSVTEPEAVESALAWLRRERPAPYSAVVSLGAESFVAYLLSEDGHVTTVESGNKCASGTGEFFLQQIGRMGLSIEDAVAAARGAEPYRVSGRCSVFCKSDCTHALNKGIPIGRVTAGLSGMMADKVLDLLEKTGPGVVLAVGGVTKNPVIMDLLRRKLQRLEVPPHAGAFEAFGAAYHALVNEVPWDVDRKRVFRSARPLFDRLPPISSGAHLVRFEERPAAKACDGDECIVGLDVGSTTTKAVILRTSDDAVLASVYLRTNGNPVQASRDCYRELARRVGAKVRIVALGTTGSGRQIAGLHAGTDAIVNEIIAHAAGAAYYDPAVDTVFEIGGQDAKYAYLTNGVPSDYAMNEACSAGTGSFLEEASKEALGIDTLDIGSHALRAGSPPNFNDQCAAFISSDIKVAVHDGVERDDITAGLVYSICMNYMNRVKGQRAVGRRVFMQGGVCYNKAVPMAMAVLLGKEIVVPPEPGLIGAFGLALEVKNRLRQGSLGAGSFDLEELAAREVEHGRSFVCAGGKEKCDRKCEISTMTIAGRKYAFGGACNRYYNIIHHVEHDAVRHDFVRARQQWLFETYGVPQAAAETGSGPRVGLNRSFLFNSLYPLYSHFFTGIGCRLVLPDVVDEVGVKRKRTALCYPFEIAHGWFASLLARKPDAIFLPRIVEMEVEGSPEILQEHQCTCQLLQGEPYCLKSAFKAELAGANLIEVDLNLAFGYLSKQEAFVGVAARLGVDRPRAVRAYGKAVERQLAFEQRLKEEGRRLLAELERNPEETAVVLFGRSYNAFAAEANLGIPGKFASRGVTIIPWDLLPVRDEPWDQDMMWATGQELLRAARFVKRHPQLYGAFITNFSCGPDSLLLTYFRDILGIKPSLTLELDSHSADAGVNTRIEAFVDVVQRFRRLRLAEPAPPPFRRATVRFDSSRPVFETSDGKSVSMYDPSVRVVFPSMGRLGTELISAAFEGCGFRTRAIPVYDFEALRLGRGNTSCKECLPLILVCGGLLRYLKHERPEGERTVYFMPTSSGGCRLSQYHVFLKRLIEKQGIPDVAVLSLTADNGYVGLSIPDLASVIRSVVVSDVMEDIRCALYVLACEREKALEAFEREWRGILAAFARGRGVYATMKAAARALSGIRLRHPLSEAKVVEILQEIFVRRDEFSLQDLIERLAQRDIVARKASILEWLLYTDWEVDRGLLDPRFDLAGRLRFEIKKLLTWWLERRVKRILSRSGLCAYELVDLPGIIECGKQLFDEKFMGEPILVAGAVLRNVGRHSHGAISIGPFGCMPGRITEAVLSVEAPERRLPFLAIETDGNAFPQVLEARIEAFCLQVERMHARMAAAKH